MQDYPKPSKLYEKKVTFNDLVQVFVPCFFVSSIILSLILTLLGFYKCEVNYKQYGDENVIEKRCGLSQEINSGIILLSLFISAGFTKYCYDNVKDSDSSDK
ncbi:hypothetical protein B9G53_09460 [Pseudanabaena sp. SR411]|uniref:hypothetical protein n=1 Tax=Pseudanabaena sp. SR411 TaxID=1980935 RepID=UPI000B9943C6|nr:hypothetical protein [Pseudanabaena sp. SR411]OYQ64932.1 hypothetical protein B9G53_09460 [Pseudanabaena sp. SR411]